MATEALPLLGFIRDTPLNTVFNTVSRRTLSIHAGFRAMAKIRSRTDYSRLLLLKPLSSAEIVADSRSNARKYRRDFHLADTVTNAKTDSAFRTLLQSPPMNPPPIILQWRHETRAFRCSKCGSNRPTAVARCFRKAAIQTTAVPRNLPECQFTQLGLNGHWRPMLSTSAMHWLTVVGRKPGLNDRAGLRPIAGPDPRRNIMNSLRTAGMRRTLNPANSLRIQLASL